MLVEGLLTEGEDGGQVAADSKRMGKPSKRTKGEFVLHRVTNQGSTFHRFERVQVPPENIRAAERFIDEADGRIVGSDPRAPVQGNAQPAEAIVDFRAEAHFNFVR